MDDDLALAEVGSLDELAACLRQLHVRAGKPSFRTLENNTKHATGPLPGTKINRVMLGRSNLSEVLAGRKLPAKAFLLTLAEALDIDLDVDRQWAQAWDRVAGQNQHVPPSPEEMERIRAENEELRQQLAAAEDLIRKQTLTAEEMATRLEAVQAQAREAQDRMAEATAEHVAELEQVQADIRAHSTKSEDTCMDGDIPSDQGTLVNRDAPADRDSSAVPDPVREVTVVTGVPRYHKAGCILTRFMGENGLDMMTIADARQAGCTPCKACLPDESVEGAQLSVNEIDESGYQELRRSAPAYPRHSGGPQTTAEPESAVSPDPKKRSADAHRYRDISFTPRTYRPEWAEARLLSFGQDEEPSMGNLT